MGVGVEDDRLVIGAPSAMSNTDRIDQELRRAPSFRIVSMVSRYRVMLWTFLFPQVQLWRSLAGRPAFKSVIGLTLPLSRGH
jgi:hypothetical protein